MIQKRYGEDLTIKKLAEMAYINTDKLKTIYKAIYGTTVHDAVVTRKLEVAYHLISNKHYSVKDTSTSIGYSNQGYFIKLFRQHYGLTPGELLKKSYK
jgi:AraC-like DNA-binding protein